MVFQTPNEDEERAVEMLICGELKKNKVALLNPKDIDGGRTKFPKSNFAVGVTVLKKGGLECNGLQVNPQRLEDGAGRITAQKWGNSSAIPDIMVSNARLLHKLYERAPPASHRQVLMLRNWDPIKDAGA